MVNWAVFKENPSYCYSRGVICLVIIIVVQKLIFYNQATAKRWHLYAELLFLPTQGHI